MDCPRIPEVSYGEFSKHLHDKGAAQRLPLAVTVELTERCNLRCAHCYINLAAGDRKAWQRELKLDQWTRILDEMAAAGTLWLLLTGGEILLHPDFREIYRYAKKLGMVITLFSNGTLITPELADFLQDWPPFEVEVTVYGRTRATYEAVTRVPGSYEQCLRGIDRLLARRLPLQLKTAVLTLNAHELRDLKAWAQDMGARFRFDPALNARLDGGKDPLTFRLPPEEVVELDRDDPQRYQELQERWQKYGGRPVNSDYLYTCGVGRSSCHLDAYGNLFPCMMVRTSRFDLQRGSLQEAWQEFLPRIREQKPRGNYPCGQCDLIVLCDNCPAWSQLECGDPEIPVSFLCNIAQLRAKTLIDRKA